MEKKAGFVLLQRSEFKDWLMKQPVNRKVTMIQNHHTWLPDYTTFKNNHFDQVQNMKNFHVNERGWSDIGQHITTFPDGTIIAGTRPLERPPAGIKGHNDEAICLEHLGNFDKRKDEMTAEHKKTIILVNAALNLKFGIDVSVDHNVYHHWYDLTTLQRTFGTGNTKTCPGTNFFGGNKVADAKKNFYPKIRKELKAFPEYKKVFKNKKVDKIIGHAMVVRANNLNVRTGPNVKRKKVGSIALGTIVDIYENKEKWSRISPDKKWVSSYFLKPIYYGIVTDDDPKGLNVRTGPGGSFRKIASIMKDSKVTIYEESDNGWYRISFLDKWVSSKYVKKLS